MDTISREENTKYWPIAALLVAVVALIAGCFALVKVYGMSKSFAAVTEKVDKIDNIESTANSVADGLDKLRTDYNGFKSSLQTSLQGDLEQIRDKFNNTDAQLAKLNDALTKPAAKAPKGPKAGGAVVAGPPGAPPGTVSADGSYTIKSGDSLAKIARANGISLEELKAANPGVDPKRLKIGQKINLPSKPQ